MNDTVETAVERASFEAGNFELRLGPALVLHGTPKQRAEYFTALSKAQASYETIQRTRTVQVRSEKGNYTFDYAPLEEVIAATRPALAANGFAWVSWIADGERGSELHTMLTHAGGAFMHAVESLPPVQKAQEFGSLLTYRRRYQYQCVTGTSPEVDDDANAADGNQATPVRDKRREPPAPPAQRAQPASKPAAAAKPAPEPKEELPVQEVPVKGPEPQPLSSAADTEELPAARVPEPSEPDQPMTDSQKNDLIVLCREKEVGRKLLSYIITDRVDATRTLDKLTSSDWALLTTLLKNDAQLALLRRECLAKASA